MESEDQFAQRLKSEKKKSRVLYEFNAHADSKLSQNVQVRMLLTAFQHDAPDEHTLEVVQGEGVIRTRIAWRDLLGAQVIEERIVRIYSFPNVKPYFGKAERKLQKIDIYFAENSKGLDYRKPTILVFVNPHSGRAQGRKIWRNVSSLFEKSGYQFKVIETLYRMHCHDYLKQLTVEELTQYYAIVTVGGDGTIHEVLNAIMGYKERDRVLQIPVGIISGGSSNALLATLAEESGEKITPECSAFVIIKGQTRAIDVIEFEKRNNNTPIYSFLTLTWGYIADVDTGSDQLRLLGPLRFQLYGLWRVISLQRYEGRLTYSADPEAKLPDLSEAIVPNSAQWRVVQGQFLHFTAANLPFLTESTRMHPMAKMDDGQIDLQYVLDDVNKTQFAKFLMNIDRGEFMDQQTGRVREGYNVQYEKVRCFRLEPLTQEGAPPRNNAMAIDGERYHPDAVQGTVLSKMFKVFCI